MSGAGVPFAIALGSNLGDRAGYLRHAVDELTRTPGVSDVRTSSLWESIALTLDGPNPEKPAYLNAVAVGRTTLDADRLLDVMQRIEAESGRVRAERWGDRTLDLDLIDYGGQVRHDPRLTLPHPRAFQRDFVLAPWLEVAPDATLPGHGPVSGLVAGMEAADGITCRPWQGMVAS